MRESSWKTLLCDWRAVMYIVVGSIIYAAGFNLFIVPCALYSGGFLGLAQLIVKGIGTTPLGAFVSDNAAGTMYFLLNLPLLVLGGRAFGKAFIVKTVFCVGCYSVFLNMIPVPEVPYLTEEVAGSLAGGVICGIGAGIILLSKGCGGGEEILGLLLMRRSASFSIGKVSNFINVFVFSACLVLYDLSTAVYSIFFNVMYYFVLDRVHLQNITMTMLIITKEEGMEQLVFDTVHRGVTRMHGEGAYTNEGVKILLTVVSKEEAIELHRVLMEKDPNVFIIEDENVSVIGNFQKRL